jgi:hypothetical protein
MIHIAKITELFGFEWLFPRNKIGDLAILRAEEKWRRERERTRAKAKKPRLIGLRRPVRESWIFRF